MSLYRLVVLGDGGVGKTALTIQLCLNYFDETYDPTTIEDSYRAQGVIDGQPCILEVLDTVEQEEYPTLRDQWIRDGDGFLIVYSIIARSTFESVEKFRNQILRVKETDEVPIVLVGNKCDIVDKRDISREEGYFLAKRLQCEFIETSAKTCTNVEKAFYTVVRSIHARKPVIYLYPEKQMDIAIKLNIKKSMKISVVYPKFNDINNTWKVKAEPNGDIILNNKKYPYLFYELDSYIFPSHNEGFIVKDEEAETFLENKLKILGLNEKESTDFITYWLPVLLKNKMSLCTFQNDVFLNNFELNINPKPDTLIRIFLSIKKIDSIPNIKEQKLEKIERKGYTVVEWGGTNLKN